MANTKRILEQLVNEKMPFFLVINKVDRLILELKLPPMDAYFKLKHTIEEVNSILNTLSSKTRLSPEAGNVCFAASNMGWSFTLQSFAKMYANKSEESFDHEAFAKRLWGDIFFDTEKRCFRKTSNDTSVRSFLHFILEPLYKLYSTIIGEDAATVGRIVASLGIYLKSSQLTMDVKPLLSLVCSRFFGSSQGFVSMCISQIPSPAENAAQKVKISLINRLNIHILVIWTQYTESHCGIVTLKDH
jgi:U5 small nuclear ribonucleoprotein component